MSPVHVIWAFFVVACYSQANCVGASFDLTLLKNNGAGYSAQSFSFPAPLVMVSFCEALVGSGCAPNTAVCQDSSIVLAQNQFTTKITESGSVLITYQGGTPGDCMTAHQVMVNLECDAQSTELFLFVLDRDDCVTQISGTHCAACAAGCPGGPSPPPPTPAPPSASGSPSRSQAASASPTKSPPPGPPSASATLRPPTPPPPTPPPPTPPPPTPPPPTTSNSPTRSPRTPPPPDAIESPSAPNVHTTIIVSVIMGVLGVIALSIIIACLVWMYKGGRRKTEEPEEKAGAPLVQGALLVPYMSQTMTARPEPAHSRSRSRRRYDSDDESSSDGGSRGRSRSRRDRSRSKGRDRSRSKGGSSRKYDETGRQLPKHWRMARDPESGQRYYYHTRTGVRTVTRPADYEDSTAIVSRLYPAV